MLIATKQTFFFRIKIAVLSFLWCSGICFGQSTWESINLPQGNDLYSVTYCNNQFVAVGEQQLILASSDGTTWNLTQPAVNTVDSYYSVAYGNGLFVAVGYEINISTDGTVWTYPSDTLDTNYSDSDSRGILFSVTYGNGRFVTVGEGGAMLTSPDGINWIILKSITKYDLHSVIYANPSSGLAGQFVAVGDEGTILTSSDGRNWSIITYNPSSPPSIKSITYGNGMFVAVGGDNPVSMPPTSTAPAYWLYQPIVLVSSNAATWEEIPLAIAIPNPGYLQSVTYGNGQFVAIGGGCIVTSSDGATWTLKNSNIPYSYSVTYGNGLFVAVGYMISTSKADNAGAIIQPNINTVKLSGIKINVANNLISAILPYSTSRSQIKVGLFNVSGKRMYSAKVETRNGTLNIPAGGFPAGKYFMSTTDESNKSLNSSFVLTR